MGWRDWQILKARPTMDDPLVRLRVRTPLFLPFPLSTSLFSCFSPHKKCTQKKKKKNWTISFLKQKISSSLERVKGEKRIYIYIYMCKYFVYLISFVSKEIFHYVDERKPLKDRENFIRIRWSVNSTKDVDMTFMLKLFLCKTTLCLNKLYANLQ